MIDLNEDVTKRIERFRVTLPPPPQSTSINCMKFLSGEPELMHSITLNRLNDLIKYLEDRDLEVQAEVLLDSIEGGRRDVIVACATLVVGGAFYNASQVLELVVNGRLQEFNSFFYRLQFDSMGAIEYLESLFSKTPQNLQEMRPDDHQLKQLLAYTAPAGMNFQQQQAFNTQYAQNELNRVHQKNLQIDSAEIEMAKKRAENDEEIRFALKKQEHAIVNPMTLGEAGKPQVDYDELAKNFIQQKHLVKTETDGEIVVYHWDNETKRYRRFDSQKTLTNALNSYAYEICGSEVDIVRSQLDASVNKMQHMLIPKLTDELEFPKSSSETQVFFENGYYDLQNRNFVETDTSEYFHIFSLPFKYDASAKTPKIFDKMLTAMFNKDQVKKRLAYQIIGAILSNVSLKYIYLLQGVSHGGKSTFAECIARIFRDDEVKSLGSMDDINSSSVQSFEKRFKLLYVDDAPNSKWNNKTVGYLKSRSRGIGNPNFPSHKILLSTNYAVSFFTIGGRDPSVENRIIVLPFDKDMKAAENDENLTNEERQGFHDAKNFFDENFEIEKQGIVKKALEAFQEVLEENKEFISNFPLNDCVKVCAVGLNNANKNWDDKILELQEFIETNFELVDEQELQNAQNNGIKSEQLFEMVDKALPKLFGSPNSLGKAIKQVIVDGSHIVTKDNEGKRFYNLSLKVNE